jgi:hypothetical protein
VGECHDLTVKLVKSFLLPSYIFGPPLLFFLPPYNRYMLAYIVQFTRWQEERMDPNPYHSNKA